MNDDKRQQRRTAVSNFFDLEEENKNQSDGSRNVNFNLQELEDAAADIEQFLQQKQKTNENIESKSNTAADGEPRKE